MTRARANGEGTIFAAGDKWRAQLTLPSGRRVSSTHTTQRKARAWLTQKRREVDTDEYVEPSDMPLGEWWDKWKAAYKEGLVGEASLSTYRYARARMPKTLFATPIREITTADIQTAVNALTAAGKSRKTLVLTLAPLRMCLAAAVEDGMLRKNPADRVTLPPVSSARPAKALTPDDEKALVAILENPVGGHGRSSEVTRAICDALLMILYTGMRRCECLGLLWSDVRDRIHVRGTKTESADRYIPITPAVQKIITRRESKTVAVDHMRQPVFSVGGQPLDGAQLLRFVSRRSGYTVHDLRHTYATRAMQSGVNPKVLQSLLGHANIETTLGIYTHVSDADTNNAAAQIAFYCTPTARET